MSEFFKTLMGRKFYEADVPRIARALERIADALEKTGRPPGVTDQRVKVAIYSNDPGAYADLVTAAVLQALADIGATRDLLGDLMHYADEHGLDFTQELTWAEGNYEDERDEETEDDED